VRVTGEDATGGGAVFSSDGPLYNRVLRKKLIGLFCGGCGGCFLTSFRVYIHTPHRGTAELRNQPPQPPHFSREELSGSQPAESYR
jgi:hypothetical protein